MHTTQTHGIPPAPIKALSASAGILSARRTGFTLVELLVVIVILAMLASLVTVAASRAITAARNAAIKAEIDMLHMAIMTYKNEYGSFPPCSDVLPPPIQFPAAMRSSTNLARSHIQRLFPRATAPFPIKSDFTEDKNSNGALDSGEDVNGSSGLDSIILDVNTALPYWLFGYSSDPLSPTIGQLRPLFSFDKSRLPTNGSYFTGQYFSSNMPTNGFYRYVNSASYYFRDNSGNRWPMPGVEFNRATAGLATSTNAFGEDSRTFNGTVDQASPFTEDANLNGTIDRGLPFNEDTFQILHPGRDGQFGTEDDLSNFWPSTRKAFIESLSR
jgi:prepilin-type N-terminal cleavage/methylation domain-containing protein